MSRVSEGKRQVVSQTIVGDSSNERDPRLAPSSAGSLAEVLERSERATEAMAVLEEALAIYEAKGAVPHVAQVRSRLERLRPKG